MLLTNVTDNWVPIVSKISRNFISSSALLTASFSSRTHSRRKRRYQRSDLDSSPCQSSREDRYRSVYPSALPRVILSVFWVPGHTAEMTDKTEVTSLSQLHRKCPPPPIPAHKSINLILMMYWGILSLLIWKMLFVGHIDHTEQAVW